MQNPPEQTDGGTRERRDTLRLDLRLPFQWRNYAEQPTIERINEDLGADPRLELRWEVDRLRSELDRALAGGVDAATVAVVKILGRQLELLGDAALAPLAPPPAATVNLSAEGLGFHAAEALATGTWLGVHLVLTGGYPLLASARVNRCDTDDSGQRIGARLVELSPGAERRLNRFLLQQSRAPGTDRSGDPA